MVPESDPVEVCDKLRVLHQHVVRPRAGKQLHHDGNQIQQKQGAENHQKLEHPGRPAVLEFGILRHVRRRQEDHLIKADRLLHRIENTADFLFNPRNRRQVGVVVALLGAGVVVLQRLGVGLKLPHNLGVLRSGVCNLSVQLVEAVPPDFVPLPSLFHEGLPLCIQAVQIGVPIGEMRLCHRFLTRCQVGHRGVQRELEPAHVGSYLCIPDPHVLQAWSFPGLFRFRVKLVGQPELLPGDRLHQPPVHRLLFLHLL